jgi:hypothetical protein
MHRNDSITKTTGIEPYIIEIICLRLHEKEALSYLSDKGYDISAAQLYRLKNDIKENRQLRLNHIASEEFMMQHLERIENLKTIEGELWNNYHTEQNPTKKASILMQIAEMQTYLSSYYDHTQYIMQQAARASKSFTSPKQEKN